MKLYTRTGDDGTTGLFGGDRVEKDDPRVGAYGTIDELNATVGVAVAACDTTSDRARRYVEILTTVQSRLFDIGADLATPPGSKHADKVARFADAHVAVIEGWIDEVDEGNPPMTHFVLPGGTEVAARLHLARAVCRRAERRVVTLGHAAEVTPGILVYLNRLSDLLFAMARAANADANVPDVPWIPGETE
jgi:cob(I)alamin adenosyltransferase